MFNRNMSKKVCIRKIYDEMVSIKELNIDGDVI